LAILQAPAAGDGMIDWQINHPDPGGKWFGVFSIPRDWSKV
jgi:alkyl hydroperoxide reductase subunit AhpC